MKKNKSSKIFADFIVKGMFLDCNSGSIAFTRFGVAHWLLGNSKKGNAMKKLSILLICCFAVSAHAMDDAKAELVQRVQNFDATVNKGLLTESLLIGGVAVSKIIGDAADPEYALVARVIPLLPGLALVAYHFIIDLKKN